MTETETAKAVAPIAHWNPPHPAARLPGQPIMTVVPAPGPVVEGRYSLEVRWILPGRLQPAVAGWFGRFPAEMASRADTYLLSPDLRGLSVKLRAGTALEVKEYRGSPGILDIGDRARGRIESWRKWSFPFSLPIKGGDLAGWRVIGKKRRVARFPLTGGPAVAAAPGSATEATCAVELTEICSGDRAWWSLGFEATGPADRLRGALQTTAVRIFAEELPGNAELGMDVCQSYAQWLSWQLSEAEVPEPATRRDLRYA